MERPERLLDGWAQSSASQREATLRQGVGKHLIAECWGCNDRVFSAEAVREAVEAAVKASGATLLQLIVHTFEPVGLSGVAIISESHIFIHTWPEMRYVAVDVFTCGETFPERALEVIRERFEPEHLNVLRLDRGLLPEFFTEEQTDGVQLRLKVRRWLVRQRTRYQELLLADTAELGRLLALDGKVMLTEADEAFYHEMLVHPALMSLEQPETVLIIGGGDGGAVREVLRHPSVRKVYVVEIDEDVVATCRQWLPAVHQHGWDDPRVELVIAPGEQWLQQWQNAFDAIIVDGCDPVGPAVPLFETPFFRSCQRALKHRGILALQCGTPFYFRSEVHDVWQRLRHIFSAVKVYLGFVPTYPSGLWAYAMAGQFIPELSLAELSRRFAERRLGVLRYYTPEVHLSSFALPPFVRELLV